MRRADADVYQAPYEGASAAAAQAAVAATMARFDLKDVCTRIDAGYTKWRTPSLLAFGPDDNFISNKNEVTKWLENKRTAMRNSTFVENIGHHPQEDYPEAVAKRLAPFLKGELLKASAVGYLGVR